MNNNAQAGREDRLAQLQQQRCERRNRRRVSAILTLLAIVLLIGAVILILNDGSTMLAGLLGETHTSVDANADVQEARIGTEKYSTVTITAVGNISISDAQLADARTGDGYDFSRSFLGVADLLCNSDLTVGNLECTLAGAPYGNETASAPTALADTLAGLGFDLLQTANSASIIGGITGLDSTIDNLRGAGIEPVGTFRSKQEREDYAGITLREINGIRVAFVAFTKGLGNMSLPENKEYCVNLLYSDYDTNYRNLDTAAITSVMEAARKKEPDIIIALVHWGSEFSREITKSQKRVADLLYENGADAIIGTHSHLVNKIERSSITLENGTAKDVVTAYDLGNFYTDSTKSGTQTGVVLNLEFTRNNWTNQTMLTNLSYTPVYCADFGTAASDRYQVLNIERALELYDQEYVFRISEQLRETLQSELEALPEHIDPQEPEESE